MIDKIILSNLAFYGYHGVLKAENQLGQKFFIDVELALDLTTVGETDDLQEAVNYAEVYELIKEICENREYNLVEALAENIAQEILAQFKRVEEVMIKVKKPEAPVEGIFDYMGIEIKRKR
ncbi:MAG: dihydroneopterin aldolase [Halanaerobacter sp.]